MRSGRCCRTCFDPQLEDPATRCTAVTLVRSACDAVAATLRTHAHTPPLSQRRDPKLKPPNPCLDLELRISVKCRPRTCPTRCLGSGWQDHRSCQQLSRNPAGARRKRAENGIIPLATRERRRPRRAPASPQRRPSSTAMPGKSQRNRRSPRPRQCRLTQSSPAPSPPPRKSSSRHFPVFARIYGLSNLPQD